MIDELALYNKVGDLYVKRGDTAQAVEQYEKAIEHYTEQGFPNNAIALCNKVLRNAPARTHVYLRLAQLMMQRGFVAEAKQNLLEYAERMEKAGQLEDAFHALKEFADLSSDNEEIRLLLAEQLKKAARSEEAHEQLAKLYQEVQAGGDERRKRRTMDRMRAIDPEYDVEAGQEVKTKPKKTKTSEIVFLNLDEDVKPAAKVEPDEDSTETPEVVVDAGESDEDDGELKIQRASMELGTVDEETTVPAVDGLDVGESFEVPEEGSVDVLDIEPTVLESPGELPEVDIGDDLNILEVPFSDEGIDAVEFDVPDISVDDVSDDDLPMLEVPVGEDLEDIELDLPESLSAGLDMEADVEVLGAGETAVAGGTDDLDSGIEIPVLEGLGTDDTDESGTDDVGGDLPFIESGDLDDWEKSGTEPAVAVEVAEPSRPDISALESMIADDPDDPGLHRELAEALIESGDRERGMQELDIALDGYEAIEDWQHAEDVADEILRLDPNSVRHHQKRVEYAMQNGESSRLADAYLELADALLRTGELDKAKFVYGRVIEHDPENERAKIALETMVPDEADDEADEGVIVIKEAIPEEEEEIPSLAPEPEVAEPAEKDAGDSFIDLGAMIMEEHEADAKDARMRIDREEPTGDEESDFAEMLSEFKRGIDANIEADDSQAHYDLGVAFKEMGLLDEAIQEFQKALRGKEGRLRTSESLGLCFYEKGQFAVAATVLRRAIDAESGADEEKIGLIYWLGRCEEEQGHAAAALMNYERIFAFDVSFQDVGDRVRYLAQAGK